MALSRTRDLSDKMRVLCLHGIDKDSWGRYGAKGKWHYQVTEAGFKDNMPDISAADQAEFSFGRSERTRQKERAIAARYDAAFSVLLELEVPPRREDSEHCWHLRWGCDSLAPGWPDNRQGHLHHEEMADLRRSMQCAFHPRSLCIRITRSDFSGLNRFRGRWTNIRG